MREFFVAFTLLVFTLTAQAELPAVNKSLLKHYDALVDELMQGELATTLQLDRCDQIGLVVHGLDSVVEQFEPLLGEFKFTEPGNITYLFRSEEADVDLSIATALHGELQVEIIAVNSGKSPHSEFLNNGNEGVHHFKFHVDDVEETVEKARALGYENVWTKSFWILGSVAYIKKADEPYYIELLDLPAFLGP